MERERDEFKVLLFEKLNLGKKEETVAVTPQSFVKRETPGQIAARLESAARRKFWEDRRREAELAGEIPVSGETK